MALRAAVRWRVPPLKMWGLGDGERFTHRDRLLALALEYYEASIVPSHGLSAYITTHPDYEGHFEVKDDLPPDLASQLLENYRESREKADNPVRPWERIVVTFDQPGSEVTDGG